MNRIFNIVTRTKHLKPSDFATTPLNRCLTTADLTALAISSTVGTGIYVLTGEVTRLTAGPSVILSFSIAAFVSILCCLCYAEFGARFPKAGSGYIYSYVTVGELVAFTIGWNLLLEYVVGTAATARVWGSFTDALFNNKIQHFIISIFGTIHSPFLAKYPDFLAFLAVVAVVIVIALGVKQSVTFNWFFLILNMAVIIFITITGLCLANWDNWNNFFPFGFRGTMAGAAILFYSFIGFDVVGSCGEEAKTPTTSIPNAMIACLVISLVAYLGVSVAVTLMVPYNQLTEYVSVADAFEQRGFVVGKYLVAMGAAFALLCGITGQIFPLPRVMYAMASDGLFFRPFAKINERTGTPLQACFLGGALTALLTLFLDLIALVEMLSIGTLLAYTIVALCVLLLRYRPGNVGIQIAHDLGLDEEQLSEARDGEESDFAWEKVPGGGTPGVGTPGVKTAEVETPGVETAEVETSAVEKSGVEATELSAGDGVKVPMDETPGALSENGEYDAEKANGESTGKQSSWIASFYYRITGKGQTQPTDETYHVVKVASGVFVILCAVMEASLIYGLDSFESLDPAFYILIICVFLTILFTVQVIANQPQSKNKLPFMVPLVPMIPLLSIFMNIYLILMLSFYTWIRFVCWMTIGMLIYIFYGVKHSKENPNSPYYNETGDQYSKLPTNDEGYSSTTDIGK